MIFDELDKLIWWRGEDAFEIAIDCNRYKMADINTIIEIRENIETILYRAVEEMYWRTYD